MAQGPPLGGTGPPLSGTRASSRYRGLPQSPQHRGVGPFGTVSLLPTQGPPSILSAQRTVPTSIGASSRHRGLLQSSQHRRPSGTEGLLPAQRASSRHRGLLSAAQGPPLSGTEGLLSAAQGPPLGGTGPPLSGTRASSRHRGLPQSSPVSLASSRHIEASFNPRRTENLPAQRAPSILSNQP